MRGVEPIMITRGKRTHFRLSRGDIPTYTARRAGRPRALQLGGGGGGDGKKRSVAVSSADRVP